MPRRYPKYPLEEIATIKQKKFDEAEKLLNERKRQLEKEKEKLSQVEKERDKVRDHRLAKLTQLREKMDEGAPAEKVEQMKYYLKEVDEKLKVKESKVKEQKKAVEHAEVQVENARKELLKRQQEVEKMRLHKKEWEKEIKLIHEREEGVETDEIGSVLHHRNKVERKKRDSI